MAVQADVPDGSVRGISDLNFLLGVRALLSEPRMWCQGRMAKGASGEPRPWSSPEAVCFCIVGAGEKVMLTPGWEYERAADKMARLLDLSDVAGDKNPIRFNDAETTTFEVVIAKLDGAIAQATQAQEAIVAPSQS